MPQLHVIFPAASYVPGGTLQDVYLFCGTPAVPNKLSRVVLDITASPFAVAEVVPDQDTEWEADYVAATKIVNACNGDITYVAEYITDLQAVAACCSQIPPAPPSPSTIANLWLWLRGDMGVTGTTAVTGWADQSGNARNFTSESGKEPALQANALNGLAAVARGAINASMLSAANFPDITTSGMTIFMVAKQNNAGSLDANGAFMNAGAIQNIRIRRAGGLGSIEAGANTTTGAQVTLPGVAEDTFYTIRLRTDNTNQSAALNNGTPVVAANSPVAYTGAPIQLFAISNSAFGNKSFAEIILYNRALNSTEITNVENYLRNKYAHY